MKANKKTLMAVKYFLQNEQESWDKEAVIAEAAEETKMLTHKEMGNVTMDECGVAWEDDELCNLDDFVSQFTDLLIEKFCNVLDSFVGEDIRCYEDVWEE